MPDFICTASVGIPLKQWCTSNSAVEASPHKPLHTRESPSERQTDGRRILLSFGIPQESSHTALRLEASRSAPWTPLPETPHSVCLPRIAPHPDQVAVPVQSRMPVLVNEWGHNYMSSYLVQWYQVSSMHAMRLMSIRVHLVPGSSFFYDVLQVMECTTCGSHCARLF